METNQTPLNIFERLNRWIQESITVKLMSIGFLVLMLLIPSSWIQDLMHERQSRAEDVMQEVSNKWSGSQTLSGPILVIPFKIQKKSIVERGHRNSGIHPKIFSPSRETLDVNGNVDPTVLHRGIFDAAVYTSSLNIKANFNKPDFTSLDIANEMVLWKDAYMIFSVTNLRGISENPGFTVGGAAKLTEPSSDLGVSVRKFLRETTPSYAPSSNEVADFSSNGIIAKLGWQSEQDFVGNTFIKIKLKGSSRLSFNPTGKTTTVQLKGPWGNPSFDGEFYPSNEP